MIGSALTRSVLLGLALFAFGFCAAADERPNLIFVLTDDHRRDLVGCYGNTFIETPHIDRLAAEGVLFENAFVTSAICTPSRACYFLGQYERRHGVNFNSGTAVSAHAWSQSYPVLLREAGYFTGYVGKNHVPIGTRGYDTGLIEASFDYWYAGHGHLGFYPKERHSLFGAAESDTQIEVVAEGVNAFLDSDAAFIDGATSFVDQRPRNQPFLLTIAFNVPHGAGTSSMRDQPSDGELYTTAYRERLAELPLPPTYKARGAITDPKLPGDVARFEYRQDIYDYVDTPETLRERMVRHYQTVTGVDRFLGQLRDLLEKTGESERTVIVFASDHGILFGEHGLGGKALNYEPCLAIPMIVMNPRVPASSRGRRDESLVMSIDVAPTLLELGGVDPPEAMQGKSLAGCVRQAKAVDRNFVFGENLWSTVFGNPRCESVRGKRWKYLRYFANDRSLYADVTKETLYEVTPQSVDSYRRWRDSSIEGEAPDHEELFDLLNDPNETTNLADGAEHASVLRALRERCAAMVKEARGPEGGPSEIVEMPVGTPTR